ncbi:MAG: DUF4139 domain-containing protein [Proteobacteria bacterium]|nr:DUF4139 domain-containing protein [Pseudomonadota bacterium]
MLNSWKPKVAGFAVAVAIFALPAIAGAQELELKRVMLSAGGVGYFEYEAQVEGNATLPLSVRLDQVDDVLKSIVVYDDEGVAGTIRLPGREPLAQIFRDLPFGPEALSSPVMLLNSLPGAQIRATGARQVEGRLVRVVPEEMALPDLGGVITRHRVSVMSAEGMQTFLFEDADSVIFTDPELRGQIDEALEAISAHRTRDRRTLEILSSGAGKRTVRVGYVVAAPLWKASYRLTVTDEKAEKARLQGWAVLENMSGQEWKDVELTIVSGNPVTFRQALYTAYYVHRPEIPVEVLGRVLPAPDTGAIDMKQLAEGEYDEEFRRSQRAMEPGVVGGMIAMDMAANVPEESMRLKQEGLATQAMAPPPPPGQARILAAASKEAATQVTFRVPYPVSVESGQSLLVPVIDREVPAQRVALYQPATHDRHPLASVRLTNDGETGLPPGVLTLYETGPGGASYVGDAQLSTLPTGDERLVSFALDQKALVDREIESTQVIGKGRIVRGVLELTYEQEQHTTYRLKAPAREAREILIEHPRMPGWKIVKPTEAEVELTDGMYRIRHKLEAGAKAEIEVVLTHPDLQTFALIGQRGNFYMAFAENGELDPKLKKAFAEMARLRDVVDGRQRRMQELEGERQRIHQEQKRIRDNLSRVPHGSDLQKRYLAKLDQQEDALEALLGEAEQTRLAMEQANKKLGDYIRGLDI